MENFNIIKNSDFITKDIIKFKVIIIIANKRTKDKLNKYKPTLRAMVKGWKTRRILSS